MALLRLAHVNLRTTRLTEMCEFYSAVLDLRVGQRPPFRFLGVWLYCADQPVIHLVAVEHEAPQPGELKLQHFAFEASDLAAFTARLEQLKVPYRLGELPGWRWPQVHIHDPDGNALHVDFPQPASAGVTQA